jgi:hypothetical protein
VAANKKKKKKTEHRLETLANKVLLRGCSLPCSWPARVETGAVCVLLCRRRCSCKGGRGSWQCGE